MNGDPILFYFAGVAGDKMAPRQVWGEAAGLELQHVASCARREGLRDRRMDDRTKKNNLIKYQRLLKLLTCAV